MEALILDVHTNGALCKCPVTSMSPLTPIIPTLLLPCIGAFLASYLLETLDGQLSDTRRTHQATVWNQGSQELNRESQK